MSYDVQVSHWIYMRGKVHRTQEKEALTGGPLLSPAQLLPVTRFSAVLDVRTTAAIPLSKSIQMGPTCRVECDLGVCRTSERWPSEVDTRPRRCHVQRLRALLPDG